NTGAELLTERRHEDWVRSVAFSPDGSRIVSCVYGNAIRVWDLVSGCEAHPPLRGHHSAVPSLAFFVSGTNTLTSLHSRIAGVCDGPSDPASQSTHVPPSTIYLTDNQRVMEFITHRVLSKLPPIIRIKCAAA